MKRSTKISLITALLVIGTLGTSRLNAQAPEIHIPTEDSYVFINKRHSNYGKEAMLFVRRLPGKIYNTYLKFDLSELKTKTVNKAVLKLYCTEVEDPSIETQVDLFRAEGPWIESELTYDNAPKPRGGIVRSVPVPEKGHYEWDITSLVKRYIDEGRKELTLRLSDQNKTGNGIQFASREAGSNQPRLIIN